MRVFPSVASQVLKEVTIKRERGDGERHLPAARLDYEH